MRHPAWGPSSPAGRRERGRDAVRRIAETLGCPAETLMRVAHEEAYPDETAELIRLWFKIEDPAVRYALLAEVRKAAKR